MSFEFTNVLTTYQRMINDVLQQYLNQFVIIYLNDIIIYLIILKKHVNYIFKVLKYLNKRNLHLKLKEMRISLKRN